MGLVRRNGTERMFVAIGGEVCEVQGSNVAIDDHGNGHHRNSDSSARLIRFPPVN